MGKWRPRELLCWDINKGREALGKDRRGLKRQMAGETIGPGGEWGGEERESLIGCSSVPTGHGHHHVA